MPTAISTSAINLVENKKREILTLCPFSRSDAFTLPIPIELKRRDLTPDMPQEQKH